MIEATCHCGAVKFEVAVAPGEVTSCNCSICRRLGALWAYYPRAEVTLVSAAAPLGDYAWDDKSITFHHCRVCGCTTHWTPRGADAPDRMGLNARLLDPAILAGAKVRHLDGANTWEYLNPDS
ncbi:MAG TPA: GFA family protein [Caulobacteraceae bacterium]|jgi:hypothetical protein